jgi:hypothetical protein
MGDERAAFVVIGDEEKAALVMTAAAVLSATT